MTAWASLAGWPVMVLKQLLYLFFVSGHKLPYWLDFATLLCCIRSQGILPWDQDADIGMLYPDQPDGVNALRKIIEASTGLYSTYQPNRQLIQLSRYPNDNGQVPVFAVPAVCALHLLMHAQMCGFFLLLTLHILNCISSLR